MLTIFVVSLNHNVLGQTLIRSNVEFNNQSDQINFNVLLPESHNVCSFISVRSTTESASFICIQLLHPCHLDIDNKFQAKVSSWLSVLIQYVSINVSHRSTVISILWKSKLRSQHCFCIHSALC